MKGFATSPWSAEHSTALAAHARAARADVLAMTTAAGSGHPGGALSSLDIFLVLLFGGDRVHDRIVISHGHTAAGYYAALIQTGTIERAKVLAGFRQLDHSFPGHVDRRIPGVAWSSGSLGQGLSVACGLTLADQLRQQPGRTFVVMGDGEQQKGQIFEAARFAAHHNLNHLTAIVDVNGLQATGACAEIVQQDLAASWRSCGWRVIECDGHDHAELWKAIQQTDTDGPSVILARTVMGKGVAGHEDHHAFHGQPLDADRCQKASAALLQGSPVPVGNIPWPTTVLHQVVANPGKPRSYPAGTPLSPRTALSQALADLGRDNPDLPIQAVDCDLGPSVGLAGLTKTRPNAIRQCGICEHHAASLAGGLAAGGVLTFFNGFAVFVLGEVYNQLRSVALNGAPVKVIATHCGLDVGADGASHQCLDWIALAGALPGFDLLVPADANAADRMLRSMAATPGPKILATGRGTWPVLEDVGEFVPGRAIWRRKGKDGTIVACGVTVAVALQAADTLSRQGREVAVLDWCMPLHEDSDALAQAAATGAILTVEDHHPDSGLGSRLAARLMEAGHACRFHRLGALRPGSGGSAEENLRAAGLDAASITTTMRNLLP